MITVYDGLPVSFILNTARDLQSIGCPCTMFIISWLTATASLDRERRAKYARRTFMH
jgi:hypothetical protein